MQSKFFHFTLGPVQGFVSQARRTRDFWAGSFLLSWLSGVAVAATQAQGGEVIFPVPPKGYIDWITGDKANLRGPRQGSIPNRFMAKVPENFNAKHVESAVREAWLALAELVWQKDGLAEIAQAETQQIWERQHRNFWEISWVLTDKVSASNLLDRRKNWRNHFQQPEPGEKCMVMEGWQELSGIVQMGRDHNKMRKDFWTSVRDKVAQRDLAEGEQLCAIAYVKRRFVRHFGTLDAEIAGIRIKGWPLKHSMPSVSYMAAVHWLEELLKAGDMVEIKEILESAREANVDFDEWDTNINCLTKTAKELANVGKNLIALDGNVFFDHVQHTPQAYDYDPCKIKDLNDKIKNFKKAHPEFNAPLSPFYALLLMDGDSLGSQMSELHKQQHISRALEKFTGDVERVVAEHNGFLIYAGGDDVLALLPLEDALACADDLRKSYVQFFDSENEEIKRAKSGSKIETSISAAIELAHVKIPLTKVLMDSHGLLDDVAKEGCGRDALAVRVWKPGGLALEWAQPWEIALTEGRAAIAELTKAFQQSQNGIDVEAPFSSKFFYKIRERFEMFASENGERSALDQHHMTMLLAAEYLASGVNDGLPEGKKIDMQKAENKLQPLIEQCQRHVREKDKPKAEWVKRPIKVDGALLVRFLAQKGVE